MQINAKINNKYNKSFDQSAPLILIKNKVTCFGYRRISIFRPELQNTEKKLMDPFTPFCVLQYNADCCYCLWPKHVVLFFINMHNIEGLKHLLYLVRQWEFATLR